MPESPIPGTPLSSREAEQLRRELEQEKAKVRVRQEEREKERRFNCVPDFLSSFLFLSYYSLFLRFRLLTVFAQLQKLDRLLTEARALTGGAGFGRTESGTGNSEADGKLYAMLEEERQQHARTKQQLQDKLSAQDADKQTIDKLQRRIKDLIQAQASSISQQLQEDERDDVPAGQLRPRTPGGSGGSGAKKDSPKPHTVRVRSPPPMNFEAERDDMPALGKAEGKQKKDKHARADKTERVRRATHTRLCVNFAY